LPELFKTQSTSESLPNWNILLIIIVVAIDVWFKKGGVSVFIKKEFGKVVILE